MTNEELDAHMASMIAAFEADDLSFMMERARPGTDPKMLEIAFHKARYACGKVSDKKRTESQTWLAKRAYRDIRSRPVNVGDPLPGGVDAKIILTPSDNPRPAEKPPYRHRSGRRHLSHNIIVGRP